MALVNKVGSCVKIEFSFLHLCLLGMVQPGSLPLPLRRAHNALVTRTSLRCPHSLLRRKLGVASVQKTHRGTNPYDFSAGAKSSGEDNKAAFSWWPLLKDAAEEGLVFGGAWFFVILVSVAAVGTLTPNKS